MASNNSISIVRARVPTDLKEEVVEILSELDLTQSDVILDLYKYIATYKTIPFEREEIIILK
ncbi:hypothetical protein A1D22_09195 [Pasteurellaceae bacterium LFhippo2]|nr:hypothetical protein [Pasteurellaceae bacterium LFhippo2]